MSAPSISSLRAIIGSVIALAGFSFAYGATPIEEGWFVWPAAEPLTGSALDVSSLNAKPLQRITVQGGRFVTPDGTRVRFWGSNLTSADAFPASAKEAATIARRLAKGGVNIARLHHLDNPWGVGSGGSIWPAQRKEHRQLDPVQLDRLHRLIAALRDQGIYTNLNLKVSKSLVPEDGFDASVTQIPDFQKRVDIYDRRMIDLQKEYARRILTTKNPYTGLTPAEDPAVAIVELNNENSLLGYWTKDLGRGLEKFPTPFREDLRKQWNVWLARHYADDAALSKAWAPVTGDTARPVIPAGAKWNNSNKGGAAAEIVSSDNYQTLEIHVSAATGIDWNVQTSLGGLALNSGAVYTVEFLVKASHARKLGVGVSIDPRALPTEPWRSLGLLETIDVGTEWKPVTLVFPAHSVAGAPAVLSLNSGQTAGTIWIKQLQIVADCAGAGLQANQSAKAGTIPLPLSPSAAQWADWIAFLADTERSYAEEMRSYLKNELHVQAAIICSQIDYGGLTGMNREQSMEFADTHAYWQHPDFPAGASWDAARWSIRNTPQLDDFRERTFGELGNLAVTRVAGKPFTVSEYDHPAPSEFVCEMYPEIASFAARQDWDIIYPFCIGAYGKNNRKGEIRDFFDQLQHPAKWGQTPFAAVLFRRGLIAPAELRRELYLGSPLWVEEPSADVLWRKLIPEGSLDFLNARYAVSDRPGIAGSKASLANEGAVSASTAPVRMIDAPHGKVYVIESEQAAALTGYLGGADVGTNDLHVKCERFGRDFASVSALALDARPLRTSGRVLVTVVARAGNQGTKWNAAHNSFGAHWGHGPTVAERVPATITLHGGALRTVYALASDGSRARKVPTEQTPGAVTFTVSPDDHTLHYEIVTQ